MEEWFTNYGDKGFGLKGDDTGEEEARFLKRALRLRKGQTVLDAPCGAGRVSIHLAKAGCRVVGVDLTEAFIQRACERFAGEKLEGEFYAMDLRKIDFVEQFDAIFNWQGSFGYFSDVENLDVLDRFQRALRPRGRVLIDQPNREYLLRHFVAKGQVGPFRTHRRWSAGSQRVESEWTRTIDGEKQRYPMSIRLYTPSQFRTMCKQVGLEITTVYGNLTGEPYLRASRRLIIVAQK